ncbi:hypothetical protein SAMN05444141_11152 [Pseudovibrio denitrificans]|uniref:Uncharacterized protein n=1 Tax=Pseudovibrio denitrificans TaxID=258256 RepID=A0A1I7DV72_9HYPH|nr:hypothetical protein [Pseudovibrio denitrificans]SFU15569.1 hypothetical protein SAMN05444141_11152 [Pseudovibrio denitrificans]
MIRHLGFLLVFLFSSPALAICDQPQPLNLFSGASSTYEGLCNWAMNANKSGSLPLLRLYGDDEDPDCPENGDPTWDCDPTWQVVKGGQAVLFSIGETGASITVLDHVLSSPLQSEIDNLPSLRLLESNSYREGNGFDKQSLVNKTGAVVSHHNLGQWLPTGHRFYFIAVKPK